MLTSDQPLSFVHPIVADAVVAGILPSGLAAIHSAAAQLLLADGAAANQVAAHLIHAEPFGEPWVVAALRRAAHQALSQGAPEAAASYLRRALAEPPPPEERLALLIELGRIETLLPNAFVSGSGSMREAIALAEDSHQRVELIVELAKALAAATNLPAAYALLEGVLAEPDGVEPSLLVHAEASLIGAGFGDLAASGLAERVARGVARVRARRARRASDAVRARAHRGSDGAGRGNGG